MKRIFTMALSAMLLSAGSLFAQNKTTYVINHQVVDNFDGSQIQNKTICDYQIDKESGIHVIFTSDYTKQKKLSSTKVVSKDGAFEVVSYDPNGEVVATTKIVSDSSDQIVGKDGSVYVMDGEVVSAKYFNAADVNKVVSVKVLTDKNDPDFLKIAKAAKKYADVEVKRVTEIRTTATEETMYILDGKPISSSDFKNISTSQIASMRVVKSKDNPDFQKYAADGTKAVIMIQTR